MTTYILTGGNDRATEDYGKRLADEVRQRYPGALRVVSCFFATPREDWEESFATKKNWFQAVFGKDTNVVLAFPSTFREQVAQADLVYLHGGDDVLLAAHMHHFPDITYDFRGKIIIGSSAGASWLADNFWTCDWREVRKGSGLLKFNTMVHYRSPTYGINDPRGPIDWVKAEAELQQWIGPQKTITPLREGELVVVEA